jgi:hypothetical protein
VLPALAPLALLALAYLPGHAAARRGGGQLVAARLWPLPELLLGLCLMSWVGFLLAELGVFSLARVVVAVLGVTAALALGTRGVPPSGAPWPTLLAAAGIGVAALLLYLPPFETIVMASDATFHLNVGIHLARHGALGVPDPVLGELDAHTRALLLPEWMGGRIRLPGGLYLAALDADTAWPTYSHLLAVWVALFHAAGGIDATGLVGPTFAALAAWAVFLLAREAAGGVPAALATALLVVNAGQVFYARFLMPEVVSQAFTWGGLLCFTAWWREGRTAAAVLAACGLGVAMLARVELLALVPLALAIQLGLTSRTPPATWVFVLACGALTVHGAAHVVAFPSHYRALAAYELTAWCPHAAVAGGTVLGVTLAVWFGSSAFRRRIRYCGVLALAGTAATVYVTRSTFQGETTLRWLAEVVPWPMLLLAGLGLTRWLRDPALRLPALLLLVCAGAFVYDPHVTPVQLWGLRRFVPIVVPAVAVLAADALARLARAVVPAYDRAASAVAATVLLALTARAALPFVGGGMFTGQKEAVRALAERMPPDAVVFVAPELVDFVVHVPLWLAHGRETFVLSWWNWQGELRRAVPQLVPRRPTYLLVRADGAEPAVPPLTLQRRDELALRFLVPEPDPLRAPRTTRAWDLPLRLYEIGIPASG